MLFIRVFPRPSGGGTHKTPRQEGVGCEKQKGEGNMRKAVIFDFDYTLGDSTNGIAESIWYALERLGFSRPPLEAIKKTIGLSLPEAFFTLTADGSAQKAEQFVKLFHEKGDEVIVESTQLYPYVRDQIAALRASGYKTAIVTTKGHAVIEGIVHKFGQSSQFDAIVGGDGVKKTKPDPEGLLLAVSALGVAKEEALYVGDSLVDAKTAVNAGVPFAAVLTGTTTREDFAPYPRVYTGETIADIFQYILSGE